MKEELIAPCGMNCGICANHLALKHEVRSKGIKMPYCAGCKPRDKKCSFLKKKCEILMHNRVEYCYECGDFPCDKLLHIEKGYKDNFKISFIENLEYMKEHGIERFLEKEAEKWQCPECGDVICCHNGICFSCGFERLKNKKKLYRWDDD